MKQRSRPSRPALLLAATVAAAATGIAAAENDGAADGDRPALTEEFLNDPVNQEAGHQIWQKQCKHCHGRAAYPGKAPKLKPRRYEPAFVYDRVANGFRKMPAWKTVYSEQELMSIVAYVMSKQFSP